MSHLSKLTLSEKSPRDNVSPVERKRRKLIEQLDQQAEAVKLVLESKPALREVRRWARVEGSAEKQLVTKLVPIRKWWWLNTTGQVMFSLRLGNKVMEIAAGKTAIEVGKLQDLPEAIQTLRQAIEAGELDEALKVSPSTRPVGGKKETGKAS